MQTTYRLSEGAVDLKDEDHFIDLKRFPVEVVNPAKQTLQSRRIGHHYYYMPASFYDIDKPDSFCYGEF